MLPHLPPAMLIDLDDTILDAYNNPAAVWLEVVTEFSGELGGLTPDVARDAIVASARTFWDDPERSRIWRLQMFPARREVVRLAFEAVAAGGGPVISAPARQAIADRFSTLREERYSPFPGAIETLEALRGHGVRLALVTNGSSETQRAKRPVQPGSALPPHPDRRRARLRQAGGASVPPRPGSARRGARGCLDGR